MTYKNGYLPASALVTVQGAIQLETRTAAVFRAMREDCAEETHQNLTLAAPAGGYRPWAMQLDMRVPARRAYYNITPGIISGLPSGHGDGDCMDIATCLAWVKKNGWKYGVTFPLAKTDPNHARYDGTTIVAGTLGPLITEQDEDMLRIIYHANRGYAVILPYGHVHYPETNDGNNIVATLLQADGVTLGQAVPVGVKKLNFDWQWDTEVREADNRLAILPTAAGTGVSADQAKAIATDVVNGSKNVAL